jgi:PAS domain S-box-containing protein
MTQASEARLNAILDAMLDCVITIDARGLILSANAATERLLGHPRDRLIGRNVSMLMPEPYAGAHDGYLQHYLSTGEARIIGIGREVVALHADGTTIPVELGVTEMRDGERREFVGILRDLRARKQAEARQKRLQTLLAQIVDGSPVPTFVINDRHLVTHWNRACQEITGRTAEEIVGTDGHRRIFYAAERPTMADLIVDGASDEQLRAHYRDKRLTRSSFIAHAYEAEDYFPAFGDNGCWLYFTAAPLTGGNGRVIGAIETLQDVSDRRRAEEALVRHQSELEELVKKRTGQLAEAQRQLMQSEKLASIGQLAAGVAHEINNPIGFVHSNMGSLEHYFTRLLRVLEHFEEHRELIAGTGEAGKNWVDEVEALKAEADFEFLKEDIPLLLAESRDGTERVRRIVQDLRDFSRVDTEQKWELADLCAGLESTLNIVANEIKYKADVVKEYGAMPPVECIPSQLNQVFMNLMVNAAQAMPEGRRGTITLRCGSAGNEAWVEVADDGAGMSAETLKKVFDPFFTTKPVGKGTGLGLSLSYGIVEKHGGRIEVASEPGKGTTFRVVLPIRHAGAGKAP